MIKILHKYIVKEFLSSFVFGLIVFSITILLEQVIMLMNLFLSKGVSFWIVAKLFLLVIPNILSLTVPMAILFGVLLCYGRLSEDNEITIMRSTGIDYKALSAPIMLFVVIISLFLIYFNHSFSPSTFRYFRTLYKQIAVETPLAKFNEKTITEVGEYKIYAHKVNSKDNILTGVSIYKYENDDRNQDIIPWRIASSSATVRVDKGIVIFKLFSGYWQRTDPKQPENMLHINFASYQFEIPVLNNINLGDMTLKEMTSSKVKEKIKTLSKDDVQIYRYKNEYWLRWILAVAPLFITMVAVPIGIMSGKGGKAVGFGMSLGILFIFYMLLIVALNIGEKGYVPPALILWLPNLATGIAGVLLFKKMSKK